MQDIRSALYTILSADPALISYLGNGATSIMNERDLISDDNPIYPLLVISFQGAKPLLGLRDVTTEEWTLRAFNQNKGYATIDAIKQRCKQLLNDQGAALQTAIPSKYNIGRSVVGCIWVWWTPEYYDVAFKSENGGARFRVTMQESAYS